MKPAKALCIRFLLIAGAFLLLMPRPQAQYSYDANCRQAYESILSLRFAEARNILAKEKKAVPENLIPLYLENYIDFLTMVIGEEQKVYELLKDRRGEKLKQLGKGPADSPYHNFCLGEMHLQWAMAKMKFGDYTAAAVEFHKAHDLFADNEKKYPGFVLNKLWMGVIHVMVSLVPDNYRWVSNLAGLEGSLERGMNEIRQVAEYAGTDEITRIYRPQATFFLAFLTLNVQKDKKKALSFLEELWDPSYGGTPLKSPLLVYARASILMRNGFNDDALNVLQERYSMPQTFHFYFLDYLEGMARLNRLDTTAGACFERFIGGFRGKYYIRTANQKLAWIAVLRGDSVNYRRLIGRAAEGPGGVDEDKQAAFEAADGVVPNVVLLRARLLFDGGYYSKAMDELLNNPVSMTVKSKHDLLEYTYRLGRICHEQGNLAKAIDNYRQTITRGKNEPWYFAAGAAYQLGLLYENKGEPAKADSAFRVCLSTNPREYKTSLHQKAKAGLKRLEKENH
jgi:tetratricopeptide (TPR) repeat protein